jgi:hypothetical protein
MPSHSCPPRSIRVLPWILLALSSAPLSFALDRSAAKKTELRLVEIKEPDGQILSYRHLAGSTDVRLRGTHRAPDARVKLKVGSRPGFVELDINRGGISGLKPAHTLGKDFLTYVLWAVSVDGKASNLGEITFHDNSPVAVNLTTPYQTFWIMVTAEPNYAVVDPSPEVVLYSVKEGSDNEKRAIPIDRPLLFFTHYSSYERTNSINVADAPNQLLQARKAVELASTSGLLEREPSGARGPKEQKYAREALTQARTFLARAEAVYQKDRRSEEVIQFARTAAQSAENARALATGAVGGLVVNQIERELSDLQNELARLKGEATARAAPPAPLAAAATPNHPVAVESPAPAPTLPTAAPPSVVARVATLAAQPSLWFAVSGWGLAIALLFRRRTI